MNFERGWVNVAFVRTRITDPLLCITASITLRDQPSRGIIAGFDLPDPDERRRSTRIAMEEEMLDELALQNVDLLKGMSKSPDRLLSRKLCPRIISTC